MQLEYKRNNAGVMFVSVNLHRLCMLTLLLEDENQKKRDVFKLLR
jgi:hypothetical protein